MECKSERNDNKKEENIEKKCNGQDVKKKNKTFTLKQKVALVMLAVADFMCFCSMSIMAPFYPAEASKKGMTESMAGFVFGFYALVVFLSSPVFGKILPKVGVKFLFISGLLTSGVCAVIFGLLNQVDDYTTFTALSFTIRGLEAFGSSAYSTAGYVIIINIFPDHAGAVRGLLETFVGLGMSVGPAMGGLLFAIGGFALPFYVIGTIIILIAPLNVYFLPQSEKCALESKTGSLTNLLKLPPVIVICLIMAIVAMTWSYLDPTLEPHLRKFHLSPGNIGLIFLLISAMYGIFSPAFGWLTDRLDNYWWLMTVGLFGNSFVLLFLGPSPLLNFLEDSIWLNVAALSGLGMCVAMSLMPTYQFILDSALDGGFQETLGTHSVIAGLWSSIYSLGEVLGPILGGTLMEHFDFGVTSTTFACLNFLVASVATLYFLRRDKMSKVHIASQVQEKLEYYSNVNSELYSVQPKLEKSTINGYATDESIKTK